MTIDESVFPLLKTSLKDRGLYLTDMRHLSSAFLSNMSSSFSPMSSPESPPSIELEDAIGISNPQFSHGRRRVIDLMNRLHSTG
jgi:hypothetical protein